MTCQNAYEFISWPVICTHILFQCFLLWLVLWAYIESDLYNFLDWWMNYLCEIKFVSLKLWYFFSKLKKNYFHFTTFQKSKDEEYLLWCYFRYQKHNCVFVLFENIPLIIPGSTKDTLHVFGSLSLLLVFPLKITCSAKLSWKMLTF